MEKPKPKKLTDYKFMIEKTGDMKVPVTVFATEDMIEDMNEDDCLQQAVNVTTLSGIKDKMVVCPDAHRGYGFCIGGVAAMDYEEGCISPGGIGFDINCGVRLLSTPLTREEVEPKIKELLNALFENVPAGVGSESKIRLTDEQLDEVLNNGSRWAVKNGYGMPEDYKLAEEGGSMEQADASCVSHKAKARGRKQLGTLGAGNHFLEVQYADKIFDEQTAKTFGIEKEGQVTVMIHCGSRGLGHQVCSDYIRKMEEANPEAMQKLPDKDLIYAPAGSRLAGDYFKAMAAAANFAWVNRLIIAHNVRKAFAQVFDIRPEDIHAVYDVCHNIAKIEEHEIDGRITKVYLHRKGATRAFPPGHEELPDKYKKTGQPILIPGSMGTASYVLAGTERGMKESFGSTAHGAGRVMSRHKAKEQFRGEKVKAELETHNIYVKSASWKGISEEAPQVYKDIDEVVRVSHEAGIGNLVVKVKPVGVIKG